MKNLVIGITIIVPFFVCFQALADPSTRASGGQVSYEAMVVDYQGLPTPAFKEPFLVRFFGIKNSEKLNKLERIGAAQWIFPPLGSCVGHIKVPEQIDQISWAAGIKGTFDIKCPNGFMAEGELVALGGGKDGDYQSIWTGTGLHSTPLAAFTEAQVKAGAPGTTPVDLKFTLKIKK